MSRNQYESDGDDENEESGFISVPSESDNEDDFILYGDDSFHDEIENIQAPADVREDSQILSLAVQRDGYCDEKENNEAENIENEFQMLSLQYHNDDNDDDDKDIVTLNTERSKLLEANSGKGMENKHIESIVGGRESEVINEKDKLSIEVSDLRKENYVLSKRASSLQLKIEKIERELLSEKNKSLEYRKELDDTVVKAKQLFNTYFVIMLFLGKEFIERMQI